MTHGRTRREVAGAGPAGGDGSSAWQDGHRRVWPWAASGTVCGARQFGHVSAIGMGHPQPAGWRRLGAEYPAASSRASWRIVDPTPRVRTLTFARGTL